MNLHPIMDYGFETSRQRLCFERFMRGAFERLTLVRRILKPKVDRMNPATPWICKDPAALGTSSQLTPSRKKVRCLPTY